MQNFKTININELDLATNPTLIDIREEEELGEGQIDGSIHIPMMGLTLNPSQFLDKSKTYYIYCSAGGRSFRVCTLLSQAGYQVVNLDGGYNSYRG